MPLPKIDVPTYSLEIPSNKKIVQYRPFLVKEEKILLTALQGEDPKDITNAVRQIINNCLVTKDVNVDTLALFDLEYIFLQLRIRSIGETTTIRFAPRDKEFTNCKECLQTREVEVDLTKAQVEFDEKHTSEIILDKAKNIGINMKYPEASILMELDMAKNSNNVAEFFKIIWRCIDSIFDSENITATKEVPLNEGIEWIESLNTEQFQKIEQFFTTMPKLKQTIVVNCSSCDFQQEYTLEGLESFFA